VQNFVIIQMHLSSSILRKQAASLDTKLAALSVKLDSLSVLICVIFVLFVHSCIVSERDLYMLFS